MMSPAQFEQMERDGLVTIDSGLTAEEVRAAADAVDQLFGEKPDGFIGSEFFQPALLHIMQHPELERTARQMLRSDRVRLRGTAIRKSGPRVADVSTLEGEHADIRYSLADLDATPRRMLCTILVWFTDVTPRRAPFMFRPGSHRQLAACFDDRPRVDAFNIEKLPKLPYAEPVPALARAGQISVGTTGVIHSGSLNIDTQPRKVMFLQYEALDVPHVIFNESMQNGANRFFEQVRERIDASRHYLFENVVAEG